MARRLVTDPDTGRQFYVDDSAAVQSRGTNMNVLPDGTPVVNYYGQGWLTRDQNPDYFDSIYGRSPSKGGLLGAMDMGDIATAASMFGAAYGGGQLLGGLGDAGWMNALGGAEGIGGAGSAAMETGGSGMWDWLNNLVGTDVEIPTGQMPSWASEYGVGSAPNTSGIASSWQQQSDWGDAFSSPSPVPAPAPNLSIPGYGDIYGSPGNILKSIPGAGQFLNGLGGQSAGRGILDTIKNDPLQAAFNATPFLLAMSEANRQSNDLNGVLNSINGEAYTRSVLNPYDRDTGIGRQNLQSDLGLRGVAGSSFGYQALDNYDYNRALGRGDLANRGLMSSAQLAGNLINQRNTNRNLLLGAGLNASGSLFKPQQDYGWMKSLFGVQ